VPPVESGGELPLLLAILTGAVVMIGTVRVMKKRKWITDQVS